MKRKNKKKWHFLWEYHSNGYSYPTYEEWYNFKWGNFAAIIAIVAFILAIIGLWT